MSVHKRYTVIYCLLACTLFIVGAKCALKSGADSKHIINVPYISQEGCAATGCELVSATMVLNYYGCHASVEDVIRHTPVSNITQTKNGLSGDDPAQYFIGDPYSPNGYGCYAPVIVSVMNDFFKVDGTIEAVNLTGKDIDTLINGYIKSDNPVLIWATSNMKEPAKGNRWILRGTDKTFQWIAGEHCLVLVGCDENNYYFNDPYNSNGVMAFDKSLVAKRYISLGKQAVAVRKATKN